MSKTYYTNLSENFSKVKKIEGIIGKDKNGNENSPLIFREYVRGENGKETIKEFKIKRVDTRKFLLKKYWWIFSVIGILYLIFIYKYIYLGIAWIATIEAMLYFLQPFKTYDRAKKYNTYIMIFGSILFLVSGFFLFGNLDNMRAKLDFVQFSLYGTVLLYARYHIEGMFKKYKEIYLLLLRHNPETFSSKDDDDQPVYIWRDQI